MRMCQRTMSRFVHLHLVPNLAASKDAHVEQDLVSCKAPKCLRCGPGDALGTPPASQLEDAAAPQVHGGSRVIKSNWPIKDRTQRRINHRTCGDAAVVLKSCTARTKYPTVEDGLCSSQKHAGSSVFLISMLFLAINILLGLCTAVSWQPCILHCYQHPNKNIWATATSCLLV